MSDVPHLVLAGAGHAHVIAMRDFIRERPRARITLVTREVHTPYSGMIPGVIAGHYAPRDATIDTRAMSEKLGAELVEDEIVGLDAERRVLSCASGAALTYDLLSVDVGSQPNVADSPGARAHALPVKPIDGLLARIADIDDLARRRGYAVKIVVVGGGAGGTELALSINHRLRRAARDSGHAQAGIEVVVASGGKGLLPGFPDGFRRRAEAALVSRGLRVRDARAQCVDDEGVTLDDGSRLAADVVLWATQAGAQPWIGASGLATDERGFLSVDACLRSTSHANVFAAGDIAHFTPRPLPKSGVFAVRQGPVLAQNLRAFVHGGDMRAFEPQRNVLYILSTGNENAIATRNGMSIEGRICWWLKDYIDRRFIQTFRAN